MRYLLIFCLSISLALKPNPVRAEFSTAILAAGIVIGIAAAEISNYYNKTEENNPQEKAP